MIGLVALEFLNNDGFLTKATVYSVTGSIDIFCLSQ